MRHLRASLILLALLSGLLALVADPAGAVASAEPPTISGEPTYGQTLRADPGTWDTEDLTFDYRWLRDGASVVGADAESYRLSLADLGARMSVQVTATNPSGESATALSAPTDPVARAELVDSVAPRIRGELRWTRTVRATPGRWNAQEGLRLRYHWVSAGRQVGAGVRHLVAPEEVGRRLTLRVAASAPGYRPTTVSVPGGRVRYRVPVRRTVTYSVDTRGRVQVPLARFARLVQLTYADPRGWRDAGIRFRPVGRGGDFTVVLAQARTVPSFSAECSAVYSCRVGRFVIINQTRWRHASPAWRSHGGSVADYRHLVVNHETGHWLGLGHAHCPHPGAPAPVMQQQSKDLEGCLINPWPTRGEVRSRS